MEKKNSGESILKKTVSLSPEVRKYLSAFSLSVGLLLGGNGGYKNEAQANLLTSPTYFIVPGNIYNSLFISNNSNPSEYKKNVEIICLQISEKLKKENIGLSDDKIMEVNRLFIEHLQKIYNSKEQKSGLLSMGELLEIGKQADVSDVKTLHIIKIYIANQLIPENITKEVLYGVVSFYPENTFLLKLTEVEMLYKNGKVISEESIYPIFKEYFDEKYNKESEQKKIALSVIVGAFLLAFAIEGGKTYLTRNDK